MRRALVVDDGGHGESLARLVNRLSKNWRVHYYGASRLETFFAMFGALQADVIVAFGGPEPNLALVEMARRRRIPIVVVWYGKDVAAAGDDPHLLEIIKSYGLTNVAIEPWLVDELKALGIHADYVALTFVARDTPQLPLPDAFNVVTCLPKTERSPSDERTIYAIARALPDRAFTVLSDDPPNSAAPDNVRFVDYGHARESIAQATVVLSMSEYGDDRGLVLDAIAQGRHAVWNREFHGAVTATALADAVDALSALASAHDAGSLRPNDQGAQHVRETFSPELAVERFEDVLARARELYPPGAPERPRRVAISGLHLFAAQIASHVEKSTPRWDARILRTRDRVEVLTAIFTLATCNVWYSIGSPIGDRWLYLFARLLRKPRVIHWVGSDIQTLYSNRSLRKVCTRKNTTNLAEVDWTIDELAQVGIGASLAPLPPHFRAKSEVRPLPQHFTVLLYVPRTRGDFYGKREYERLIRAMAGKPVRFIVVGGGEINAPDEADIVRLGWCSNLTDVYAQSSVLLRLTQHDGLSIMVLEALTSGRPVLWTQDFPFVTRVKNYGEAERALTDLLERHLAGSLEPQNDIARIVAETYSANRCIATIEKAWDDALAPARATNLVAEMPS